MNRIMEQVKECAGDIFKWLVEDDYEKGLYHIYDDRGHNRIGPGNREPWTKFSYDPDYQGDPVEERWWENAETKK